MVNNNNNRFGNNSNNNRVGKGRVFPCSMPAGGGCPKGEAAHAQISHQASQTLKGSPSPLGIRLPAHAQACGNRVVGGINNSGYGKGDMGNKVAPEADHLWEMYSVKDGLYNTGEVSDTESVYSSIGCMSSIDGYSSGEPLEHSLYDRAVMAGMVNDREPMYMNRHKDSYYCDSTEAVACLTCKSMHKLSSTDIMENRMLIDSCCTY